MLATSSPLEKVIVNDAVRIITVAAFKRRLFVTERDAVRKTTNEYIEDIYDDLVGSGYVDLDDEDVVQGLGFVLNYLTAIDNFQNPAVKTVLNEVSRLAELLVDGQEHEKYNGVL